MQCFRGATPVFVDVDPENLNIDPENLKQAINSKTKAISVMHYAGIACDMDAICSVAKHILFQSSKTQLSA